jgi:hypothetical protein
VLVPGLLAIDSRLGVGLRNIGGAVWSGAATWQALHLERQPVTRGDLVNVNAIAGSCLRDRYAENLKHDKKHRGEDRQEQPGNPAGFQREQPHFFNGGRYAFIDLRQC